ncbi:MAG: tetratricopeptide repeat protein [Planctomycetes bacterium]|nr:tetratricopeptide repeat protein [Planctomycetota bacterium]
MEHRLGHSPHRQIGWILLVLLFGVGFSGCAHRQAIQAARSENAEKLSLDARRARERGDLLSAETLLTAAVERNPTDDDIRLELAELLLVNRKPQTAERHLQLLLDRLPDDSRVYAALAEVRFQQQRLQEANVLVAEALDLDPRLIRGLMLRARIAQSHGEIQHALDDLYQVLDIDPNDLEARLLVARLHIRQGDVRLAAAELRSLIENPNLDTALKNKANWLLGRCYAEDERWAEAAEALSSGIASRQIKPRDWCLVAEARRRAGDRDGAEQALTNALHIAPDDPDAMALQAVLKEEQARVKAPAPAVVRTGHREEDTEEISPLIRPPLTSLDGPRQGADH